jgi:hypothetical protein
MNKLSAYDAWILRRSLAGLSLNGELDGPSVHVKPIVELLDSVPLESRLFALQGHLCDKPDKDARS